LKGKPFEVINQHDILYDKNGLGLFRHFGKDHECLSGADVSFIVVVLAFKSDI
jgi:hypothetical protein